MSQDRFQALTRTEIIGILRYGMVLVLNLTLLITLPSTYLTLPYLIYEYMCLSLSWALAYLICDKHSVGFH